MHRKNLLDLLGSYPDAASEPEVHARFIDFVQKNSDCFERSLLIGHVTGSAWVLDVAREKVLLTNHVKLGKWLQLGGHADGDPDLLQVALREVREESGLRSCRVLSSEIFDIDIHEIPSYKAVPAHLHYDVRFLLEGDAAQALVVSDESHEVRWVPLSTVGSLTDEKSMLRMLKKSNHWRHS